VDFVFSFDKFSNMNWRIRLENGRQIADDKNRDLPWSLIPRTLLALFGATIAPSIVALIFSLAGIVPMLFAGRTFQQSGNWTSFIGIIVIIFIVSSLHVVLLGVPAFIVGWYFKKIRLWTSVVVSFLIGAMPTAIFLWPLKYPELHSTSSRWDGEKMVQTMIDGVPTFTGWTDWISAFTVMGLFGASGGLVFWLIWKPRNKPELIQQ